MLPPPDRLRHLSCSDLNQAENPRIDVRIKAAFDEGHLPRARNFCVYEVSFAEQVREAFPDNDEPLVLYGQSDHFKAAEAAFARLEEAGYRDIKVLKGGIEAWMANGYELEGAAESAGGDERPLGRYELDAEASKVRWIGRNLGNQHDGEIAAKSGWLEFDAKGEPRGGELTVDMRRISCNDIADTKLNKVLIQHLSNADFFEVASHPTARFVLQDALRKQAASPGSPNLLVRGEMTARGRSCELSFPALLAKVEHGFSFQAQFDFDRTRFGALYGSGKFFERLGMHLVNDLVNLQVMAFFRR